MRTTGRILADGVLAVVLFAAILSIGIAVGRDVERTNAIAAEPGPPRVTITKKQAAARNDPICRTVKSRRGAKR